MTIAIGPWLMSTFWFVLMATLAAFLLGCWLAFRYAGKGNVARKWRVARALTWVVVLSAVGWGGSVLVSDSLEQSSPGLPQSTYLTLDGKPFHMKGMGEIEDVQSSGSASTMALATGQVTVLNLWASWCGPCRREMPAFARAQAHSPHIRFIFANQGENADAVYSFLKKENLHLDNVVLDPDRSLMARFHTTGIPTTLFFDAKGRFMSGRVGELSDAALAEEIAALLPRG